MAEFTVIGSIFLLTIFIYVDYWDTLLSLHFIALEMGYEVFTIPAARVDQ